MHLLPFRPLFPPKIRPPRRLKIILPYQMKNLRVYQFSSRVPLTERFAVLDFNDPENLIPECPIYKEGYYCFLLIEKGSAEVVIDNQRDFIEAPVLLCGLPGDTWEWKKWQDIEGVFILFDAETVMAALKGNFSLDPVPFLNPEKRYPFIPLSQKRFQRLKLLSEDMKECLMEHPVYFDLLRAEIWQFIFLVEKEYILNGHPGRGKERKNQLMEFVSLVNQHYASHHDVAFYANEMHITSNYLNKITNMLLGISAYNYILKRIISEAKILLKLTDVNISELAYQLGYENPGYFIRLFKKMEGMTPLEYHKRGTL